MSKKNNLNIKFLYNCLLIEDVLAIGDLHIGYDSQIHGKAIFPKEQLKDIIKKLDLIFDYLSYNKIRIKKIILLGDVKHDFGTITDAEWRETLEFIDYIKNKSKNLIVIKGNHDTKLNPILNKKVVKLKKIYNIVRNRKNIYFSHGNEVFKQCLDNKKGVLVFGHLHPAINLYNDYKNEKYKCLMKGIWNNKSVYILPSFSSVSYGIDLNEIDNYNLKKFFIVPNKILKDFEIIIYNPKEDREYNFGKLKRFI